VDKLTKEQIKVVSDQWCFKGTIPYDKDIEAKHPGLYHDYEKIKEARANINYYSSLIDIICDNMMKDAKIAQTND
jgi:hypothetical protein